MTCVNQTEETFGIARKRKYKLKNIKDYMAYFH